MSAEFHREYLVRLPLPLAQLYSRANNDKDARARHDNTFYLFEALVKLAASPLIAAYLHETAGAPRAPALDQLLARLALPSLGHWVAILRELARHFGSRVDAQSHPLGHFWEQLNTRRRDAGLLALYCRTKNGVDGQPADDKSCSILGALDALVQYRNDVFGHGAGRFEAFYAQEMGPLLFPAANDVLADGVLHLLGPRGSRLVYVSEKREVDEGRVEASLAELVGLAPERMAPLEMTADESAGVRPNSVAVLWPGRRAPLALDPLLVFRGSELAEEVLFLNGDHKGRQVKYLSYTTGRTERDQVMVAALSRLLSQVVRRSIGEAELAQLTTETLSETPSVEALFGPAPAAGRRMGDFELLAELGRGGMGVVYLARQTSLGRLVALKMLPADLAGDEVALARFRREMRALGRCEHPHIVKVLFTGAMPDGQLYYAMEYVPGADLEMIWRELAVPHRQDNASSLGGTTWSEAILSASRKRREKVSRRASDVTTTGDATSSDKDEIKPGDVAVEKGLDPKGDADHSPLLDLSLPPLPELPSIEDDPGGYVRRVAAILRDAALAVQAVHDQDIVHRDVKPANLMLTSDGSRVVLMDFGLARGHSLAITRASSGGFLGTLRYAAPEQLAAAKVKVDQRADVRGLGVTLWEMLTRRRAFEEAEDDSQLASWVLSKELPLLRKVDPTLGADLEAIVARSTDRDVERRTQSAREMAEYLDLYLAGKPLPIRPPTAQEVLWRWTREHRALVASAAVAALAIVTTVVVAFAAITMALEREKKESRRATRAEKEEEGQRIEAEKQRNEAVKQRNEADKQRKEATKQRNLAVAGEGAARRSSYMALINLARQSWESGDTDQARDALMRLVPEPKADDLRSFEWYHLVRFAYGGEHTTIRGHVSPVNALAFSPDGQVLVSGADDGVVQLWRVNPLGALQTLTSTIAGIGANLEEQNGELVVTSLIPGGAAEADGRLKAGDRITALRLRDGQWVTYQAGYLDAAVQLIRGAEGTEIELEVRPAGEEAATKYKFTRKRIEGAAGPRIEQVLYSPDGQLLYVAAGDQTVRIWNASDGAEIARLDARTNVPYKRPMALSPDGATLATLGFDDVVRFWNARDGQLQRTFNLLASQFWPFVVFSPDGQSLVTGDGQAVASFDIVTGARGAGIRHDLQTIVPPLALGADGDTVAFGGSTGVVRIGSLASGRIHSLLAGHHGTVHAAAFSPDGAVLATAGDRTVRLWDVERGRELAVFRGHVTPVFSLAFAPSGRTLASGAVDGEVLLWDLTREPEADVVRLTQSVNAIALAHDSASFVTVGGSPSLFGLGDRGEVKVIDASGGQEQLVLQTPPRPEIARLSSDSNTLVVQPRPDIVPGDVRLLNRETGEVRTIARFPSRPVAGATLSPNGELVAVAVGDNSKRDEPSQIVLFDAKTLAEILRFTEREGPASKLTFSPDGKTLAWSVDGVAPRAALLRLWDVESRKERVTLKPGAGPQAGFTFSDDSALLAVASVNPFSAGAPSELRIFDPASGQEQYVLTGHKNMITAMAFAPYNTTLAVGTGRLMATEAGQVLLYDVTTGSLLTELEKHERAVTALAFGRGGRALATGDEGGAVFVWDVAQREAKGSFRRPWSINKIVFSPDSSLMAFTSSTIEDLTFRGEISVIRAGKGRLSGFETQADLFTDLAFTSDGKKLLSMGALYGSRLWDVETGKDEVIFPQAQNVGWHEGPVYAVASSPDGALIATGGEDKTIKLWDAKAGKVQKTLTGHDFPVTVLEFSPDGKMLASGTSVRSLTPPPRPGQVKLWDVAKGEVLRTLTDGGLPISGLDFSASGDWLAVSEEGPFDGSAPGKVTLHRPGSDEAPVVLPTSEKSGQVRAVAFAPEGENLAVLYERLPAEIWDVRTRKVVTTLKGRGIGGYSAAYSPDGRTLATAMDDAVILWQASTGEALMTLNSRLATGIYRVAFSPNGELLALAGGDADRPGKGAVQLWRAASAKNIQEALDKMKEAQASAEATAP